MELTRAILATLLLLSTVAKAFCSELEAVKQGYKQQESRQKDRSKEWGFCTNDMDCPLWTKCNGTKCQCRANLENYNSIKCDKTTLQLSIIRCHCVSHENNTNKLLEGKCIENCENGYAKSEYLPLPLNVSQLSQVMCERHWNRTGRLCGQCLPGHYPLAYSYDMRCVKCPQGNRNIWKYIMVAFGPLTVFYFILLLFKINVTSSNLHIYVVYCQSITNPVFSRAMTGYIRHIYPIYLKYIVLILVDIHSIWNLDFLRGLYPEICLDVSTLTVLALDYAVAIYPLLLAALSYFLIELHARNCRLVVIFWKPFHYLFSRFFRNRNSRTTVIDAFATFFLLSFTKIITTSVDLVTPVKAVDLSDNNVTLLLYNDARMEFFGREHLPYAILAIVCSTVFAILPVLLLLLYQFRWFQKLLSCLKLRHPLLQELMESFQSCYTNGTQIGTKDHRWFSAMHYILRYLNMIMYALILDSGYIIYGAITILLFIILIALIQPYKNSLRTKTDVFFWGAFGIFLCLDTATNHQSLRPPTEYKVSMTLRTIVVLIPPAYMFCKAIYWVLKKAKKFKFFLTQAKAWRNGYVALDEASLPDRIINPDDYHHGHNRSLVPVCLHSNY